MNKFQITFIIIGFFLLALMATNPSIEDHRQAVMNELEKKMSLESNPDNKWEQVGQSIGMALGQGIIDKAVSRENFLVFSITKISFNSKTKSIGYGFLGKVWITEYSIDQNDSSSTGNSDETQIQSEGVVINGLEVMKTDLDGDMYLPDAQKFAEDKGNGWRVPTLNELKTLYNNRSSIGGFSTSNYISSDELANDGTFRQIQVLDFSNGEIGWDFYCCKGPGGKVRLVRSL
jgi:hypothetical protein